MNAYDRIIALCNDWGVSMRKVEKACGMSHGVIRRWNTRQPSAERLQKVADYFGVSLLYLLGEETSAESKYHTDPEVSIIKHALKENPSLKILFDASKKLSEDDIKLILQMIKKIK